jgi:hypothetical protein
MCAYFIVIWAMTQAPIARWHRPLAQWDGLKSSSRKIRATLKQGKRNHAAIAFVAFAHSRSGYVLSEDSPS